MKNLKNLIYTIDQLLVTLPFNFLKFIAYYDVHVINNEFKLENEKKYLVVANHIAKKDPFIITAFMPIKERRQLSPFKFLTYDKYFDKLLMRNFLYFCGCFSTSKERNNGEKPMNLATKYLNSGQSVFIFPEGKRNPEKVKYPNTLGVGAIYLEKNNPDLYLVPVKIEYPEKRKIRITYKKPFRHKSFPNNLKPLAEDLMDRIYE
ncbi:MAG: lysophospholipid acyltransferase family protein [Candidatus Pacearchaeota archaeon]